MVCCVLVTATLGVVIAVVVGGRGADTTNVRIPSPSYVPAVLEPVQLTGYPEEQLPTPDHARRAFQNRYRGELDHGCAQAQNVAREHP
jgi:hypothetical protein